jgi:hypothetical protein
LPELQELLYSFRMGRLEAVRLVSCAHQAEVLVDIRHILPTQLSLFAYLERVWNNCIGLKNLSIIEGENFRQKGQSLWSITGKTCGPIHELSPILSHYGYPTAA